MWVVAELEGRVDNNGILLGMDFGTIKSQFRTALDTEYDHHLLLNENDPLLTMLGTNDYESYYPGLVTMPSDPTTENIARWIGEWCQTAYVRNGLHRIRVEVWETQVNSATWEARNGEGIKAYRTVS